MTTFDDEALILACYPYGDRHAVLSVLARHHGATRAVLRGARGGKAPKTSATQVLSKVRISAYHPPSAELGTLRRLDLVKSSFPLARSFDSATAAAVVAELLSTFCPPGEPAERPFRLGASILDALLGDHDPHVTVAYTQLWLLFLGGVLPPLDRCTVCGTVLDLSATALQGDGQPVCLDCARGKAATMDTDSLAFLVACRHRPVHEVEGPVPGGAREWLDRLTRLEAERPLRALDFLRRHGGPGP